MSIPYIARRMWTYRILCPFSFTTHCSYLGSSSNNMSTMAPRIFITILSPSLSSSSTAVWMNALGMSHVATSLFSFASMPAVSSIESVMTVGLAASSELIHLRCLLPFAQCLALMRPSFFSTRKISDSSAFAFSVGVIVATSIGCQQDRSCNCFISPLAASKPFCLNFFSPLFRLCVTRKFLCLSFPVILCASRLNLSLTACIICTQYLATSCVYS